MQNFHTTSSDEYAKWPTLDFTIHDDKTWVKGYMTEIGLVGLINWEKMSHKTCDFLFI
jgi:hypothetical protein